MANPFQDLIIFEMANNHQGSLSHGLRIVDAMAAAVKKFNVRGAVKLQYRDLDTFIHPAYRARKDVKHIPRFQETRLKREEFQELALSIREHGLSCVITPFDEASVDLAVNHGVDILKVASCSCMDWPLLDVIAKAGKPVICSTGGCLLSDVDKIVSFFEHRQVTDLALLHCVGLYPTEDRDQQLQFMRRMMQRYPQCVVGYSGHEAPDNLRVAPAVVAMGASILERHVGLPTATIKLNNYSMNPEQTETWLGAVVAARAMCGVTGSDKRVTDPESQSLRSLMRGVYAQRQIAKGESIPRSAVFFAMPLQEGQTPSGEYLETMVAERDYPAGEPILEKRSHDPIRIMRAVVHEAKGILREARIPTGREYEVELSHHYGMEQFRKFGAVIVSFINREYCKKLIIMLPGQYHPSHLHQVKEETFQVLYGDLQLELEGKSVGMLPGDLQLVRRNQLHAFGTRTGVVFEEISTTHVKGDSYYQDERIAKLDPAQRKTVIDSF
jgi:N-acetylneuraminate synthase